MDPLSNSFCFGSGMGPRERHRRISAMNHGVVPLLGKAVRPCQAGPAAWAWGGGLSSSPWLPLLLQPGKPAPQAGASVMRPRE